MKDKGGGKRERKCKRPLPHLLATFRAYKRVSEKVGKCQQTITIQLTATKTG